ncbi:FtsX-like permease family protein [Larkinella sp. VNQ87]|uniref:FtsX-like permease family protein n=1 Tax=Larkinella sp. VNQ87 TaxID=3400921 RepID=UPI003C11A767
MKNTHQPDPSGEPTPPAWADRLIALFCPPDLGEELLGDLHEQFAEQVAERGVSKARWLYVLEVLRFCRPYFLKRRVAELSRTPNPGNSPFSQKPYSEPSFLHPAMLRNYLKIALRTLWKSKGYAAVNALGLAVAFSVCTFLFLTAYLQLTYDSFHTDGDRIYQPYTVANDPEKTVRSGNMALPFTPALKTAYPEVKQAARILTGRKSLVEVRGAYFDKLVLHTDPDFLQLFSFPLLKGNRDVALNSLSSVVISESMAQTVFGTTDPMGQTVLIGSGENQKPYVVSGIIEDAPGNSTIQYDALIRIENAPNYQATKTDWNGTSHSVFIKLAPQVEQATFEERLKPFALKYFGSTITDLQKKGAQPDQRGDVFAIRLQALSHVHFDREITGGRGAPIAIVYTLLGLAFFILLIACINFINLSIARSFTRAREVGVRKSLGALKGQLFAQVWGESTVLCLVGFLLGVLLAYGLLPQFNAAFDARLRLETMLQPSFIACILSVFAVVTLLAGGYPAWQMTKFNTVEVLKGKVSLKRPGVLRNALIVTQFSLSCLLACCTLIASQQVDFLRSRPLGFQKEQVISIPVGNQADGRQVLGRLRNKLANDPSVLAITGTSVNIGRGQDRVSSRTTVGYKYKGKDVLTDWLLVDYDYLQTLNIKPLAGRDFSRLYATDSVNRIIVTASMAKMMGEKNAVGALLGDDDDTTGSKMQVIGIIPDFQLYSLASENRPITLHLSNSEAIHYIFVRVSPQSLAGSMDKLKLLWREVAPQSEFMGTFLDDNVNAWYQDEERFTQICSLAAGIAILLSCVGLFAIALMMIEQRTKEIGIRKVMGASVSSIILVLSRDFVKLVLIALLIALPLAWFGMNLWLDNYRERVTISLWLLGGVGLGAVLIALATVSFQTVKAALANPVKSLRSE